MYKILVVDDEMIFRKGIHMMLKKSDFPIERLTEACDGEEAAAILERERYDIVITDIRMPRMDGLMLCRTIQEFGLNPIVIILSGYDDFKYAQKAIEYGVSDYVLKPVTERRLREVLQSALTKRENGRKALSYEEMDGLVSGLTDALWNQEREAYLHISELAERSVENFSVRRRRELLYELVHNVVGKISRLLEEDLCMEQLEQDHYRDNLEVLWKWVYGRKHSGMLEAARRYLTEDPCMTQEEISSRLGISSTHFSAVFKEKTGKKFVDFKTEIRMERAKKLLCIPSKTITQAAGEVGYSDYSHFTRTFKKYYGVTPAEFRADRGLSS